MTIITLCNECFITISKAHLCSNTCYYSHTYHRAKSEELALEYYAGLAEAAISLRDHRLQSQYPLVVIQAGWIESTNRQILLIVEGKG